MSTDRRSDISPDALLEAERLTCSIGGRPSINGVSLQLHPGSFLGIIGPNGSGKSTLLRMLCGLLQPEQGRLMLAGRPYSAYSAKERARIIGYVPQDCSLEADFTIEQIVAMGRHPYRSLFRSLSAADIKSAEWAMRQCGVDALRGRYIHACSGGQRQLAFIAKALAQEPRLLLLDEPISALDIRHQLRTLSLLRQLAGKGFTVAASLHDLSLASRYCDRLLLLRDGRIQASGRPEEVLTPAALHAVYGIHAIIRKEPDTSGLSVIALD
ncbi:ABC transporter ATP-binding protein [Paenibacillus apiarius]|uniref:ABC transporter ATP-binding protein n=1 Tax=Paenibacillus apiarius TaxID=46240 RepID=A0ABT4E0L5_9BACL|nr:ABC transporter ATP-binding protein [Paenibacillus apiarius]MCY9512888.1 ABC transporter ATP-binding protein [Paenibacillus apiarius]MCY9522063.1 ABC transporter ATP-binding protein [Paenibacillus apiarius]MCY9554118.1 ABC transporter ATP-binding protein [Paenibacillus apiarius]MCY9558823.1 ABC transporter ATP-binding protein [Paenibacillus apiarius]MCY9683870.1 ABC transporter ATP-binding protein [Paenibacillus apiarius]